MSTCVLTFMESCQDLLNKSNLFYSKGHYKEALKYAEDARGCAEKSKDPITLSVSLTTIGLILSDAGANKEIALQYYLWALNIQEKLTQTKPSYCTLVATTLNNLGNLLRDMGRYDEAKSRYERALNIRETLLKIATNNTLYQSWVATTLDSLGNLLSDMGRQEEAKNRYEKALELYEALLATDTENPVYQSWVAGTLNNLGVLFREMGRQEEANSRYERALNIREALLKTDTENLVYKSWVAMTLNNLGNLFYDMGRQKEAKSRCERALNIREELLASDTKNTTYQFWVADTLNNLGILLSYMGRYEEANNRYERALKIREALLATDTENPVYQSWVATTLNNLCIPLSAMGRQKEAKNKYEKALELYEALLATDTENPVYQSDVSMTLNNLGNLLRDMGQHREANSRYERALNIRETLLKTDTNNTVYRSWVATTLNNLGVLFSVMDWQWGAKNRYEKALKIREELLASDTKNTTYQFWVAVTLNNLGVLLSYMERQEEAKSRYERALELYEVLHNSYPDNPIYQSRFAASFLGYWEIVLSLTDSDNGFTALEKYRKTIEQAKEKAEHFDDIGLSYESYLAKKLELNTRLKCCSKKATLEPKPKQKAQNYRLCKDIITELLEFEVEEEQKKKLSGLFDCYEGRALINESIQNGFDKDIFKEAVAVFEKASSNYDNALECYAIYSTLLNILSLQEGESNPEKIKYSIKNSRSKITHEISSQCFLKMEEVIDRYMDGEDIADLISEFNDTLLSIESKAYREIMKHASKEMRVYLKNPIEVNSHFQNWTLITEISGVSGHILVLSRENTIDEFEIDGNKRILIPFEPEDFHELVTFQYVEKPRMKRTLTISCCEVIGEHEVYFAKRRAM